MPAVLGTPITDPAVIAFVNTNVRPLAEDLVRLNAILGDTMRKWYTQISPALSGHSNTDEVMDGRATDGVSVLTKADVVNFAAQLSALTAVFAGAGVLDVLSKPTVRSLASNL